MWCFRNRAEDAESSSGVLWSLFCLGGIATAAQVLLLREFMVALLGNEIVIGVVMGNWLLAVAMGSALARLPAFRLKRPAARRRLLAALLGAQAFVLPAQILLVRHLRALLNVPVGEWVGLAPTFWLSLGIVFPTCFAVGLAFPLACRLLADDRASDGPKEATSDVSWAYAMDGAGSTAGGAFLTFALLPRVNLAATLAVLSALSLYGAIRLSGTMKRGAAALVGALLAALLAGANFSGVLSVFQRLLVETRWVGLGALPSERAAAAAGAEETRLAATATSIYQDLAVTEREGQYVLYANGHVQFVYPDPVAVEHEVHFVMAQNPSARRVLVLGGNPAEEVAELLKYPVEEVVHVKLDPMVSALVRRTTPDAFAAVDADPRARFVHEDAGRFAARSGARPFDVIFVYAPQPTTAALNRFYTVEFYRSLARLLTPRGFVYTTLRTSERLQDESAMLGASVYHALGEVFDTVLATAEERNRLLAGDAGAGLTFDRRTLYERSRQAGIATRFFRPEYFLGCDEIDAAKTAFVRERFDAYPELVNRLLRPVTYFREQLVWSRLSGSPLHRWMEAMDAAPARRGTAAPLARAVWSSLAALILLGSLAARRALRTRADAAACAWTRGLVALTTASTGFAAMSMQIVLVFLFQGIFGYIYARVGMLVALFMLGLLLGVPVGKRLAQSLRLAPAHGAMLLAEAVTLAIPLATLAVLSRVFDAGLPSIGAGGEAPIYVAVVLFGAAVGLQFPAANRLLRVWGWDTGRAAAISNAADHAGAAAGALLTGVVLLPWLGVGGMLLLLVGMKALSAAGVVCVAWLTTVRRKALSIADATPYAVGP